MKKPIKDKTYKYTFKAKLDYISPDFMKCMSGHEVEITVEEPCKHKNVHFPDHIGVIITTAMPCPDCGMYVKNSLYEDELTSARVNIMNDLFLQGTDLTSQHIKQILSNPLPEMTTKEKYNRLAELAEANNGFLELPHMRIWYEDDYFSFEGKGDNYEMQMVIIDTRENECNAYCIASAYFATDRLDPILSDALKLAEEEYGSKKVFETKYKCDFIETKKLTAKEKYEKIVRYFERHEDDGRLEIHDRNTLFIYYRGEVPDSFSLKTYFCYSLVIETYDKDAICLALAANADLTIFDEFLGNILKRLEEKFGDIDACKHEGVKYCSYCGHKL